MRFGWEGLGEDRDERARGKGRGRNFGKGWETRRRWRDGMEGRRDDGEGKEKEREINVEGERSIGARLRAESGGVRVKFERR